LEATAISTQITTAHVKQFSANVMHLAQQKKSRLAGAVRVENINGEEAYFDQIGLSAMTLLTSRHADTTITDTPHARRQVTTSTYGNADLVDIADLVRTMMDPTSHYANSFGSATGRTIDDVLIDKFFATANTGKAGGTTETFNSDSDTELGTQAPDLVALAEVRQMLQVNEFDEDEGYNFCGNAEVIRQLLTENITTAGGAASREFGAMGGHANANSIITGELTHYYGFHILRSERLDNDGTNWLCPAWATNSMLLAFGLNPRLAVSNRSDKWNSTQVAMLLDVGATRMEHKGVIRCLFIDI